MASALATYLQMSGEGENVIKALVEGAKSGDIQHIREVFDRIDGKVPAPVEVIQDDGPDYAEDPEPIEP